MAKIIIVTGVANSGKTTAIKAAMNHFGIVIGSGSNDVLICAPLIAQGAPCYVGFASGGDSAAIVQANINFFAKFPLTHMVFACRSYGAGYDALIALAAQHGTPPVILRAPDPQLSQKILSHIP